MIALAFWLVPFGYALIHSGVQTLAGTPVGTLEGLWPAWAAKPAGLPTGGKSVAQVPKGNLTNEKGQVVGRLT